MLQIHCTKKLQSYLGLNCSSQFGSDVDVSALSVWYGNVFEVEYDPYLWNKYVEKYLLLVESQSLLSFYVRLPDNIEKELFLAELSSFLQKCYSDSGFSAKQVFYLARKAREISFETATSRRMLGYLRSLSFDYSDNIRSITPYCVDEIEGFTKNRNFVSSPNDRKRFNTKYQTPKKMAKHLVSLEMRRAI